MYQKLGHRRKPVPSLSVMLWRETISKPTHRVTTGFVRTVSGKEEGPHVSVLKEVLPEGMISQLRAAWEVSERGQKARGRPHAKALRWE